ncbi:FAD-dependent oxidoreductase, partial [Vibrio cholerae]|nr:FAD-dependent oxidoreductase [Vibrio cholerae]
KGYVLENGKMLETKHSFIAFGGNKVKSDLAVPLGVEIMENNHIIVNARTKMTNIDGVWAAGDVVAHSEQVTIAMGEGSQAA